MDFFIHETILTVIAINKLLLCFQNYPLDGATAQYRISLQFWTGLADKMCQLVRLQVGLADSTCKGL